MMNGQRCLQDRRHVGEIMRTARLRQKIVEYLNEQGPQATPTIMEYLNGATRHGTTSAQLGNILSKNPEFTKVGEVYKASMVSGEYKVVVWGLTEHGRAE